MPLPQAETARYLSDFITAQGEKVFTNYSLGRGKPMAFFYEEVFKSWPPELFSLLKDIRSLVERLTLAIPHTGLFPKDEGGKVRIPKEQKACFVDWKRFPLRGSLADSVKVLRSKSGICFPDPSKLHALYVERKITSYGSTYTPQFIAEDLPEFEEIRKRLEILLEGIENRLCKLREDQHDESLNRQDKRKVRPSRVWGGKLCRKVHLDSLEVDNHPIPDAEEKAKVEAELAEVEPRYLAAKAVVGKIDQTLTIRYLALLAKAIRYGLRKPAHGVPEKGSSIVGAHGAVHKKPPVKEVGDGPGPVYVPEDRARQAAAKKLLDETAAREEVRRKRHRADRARARAKAASAAFYKKYGAKNKPAQIERADIEERLGRSRQEREGLLTRRIQLEAGLREAQKDLDARKIGAQEQRESFISNLKALEKSLNDMGGDIARDEQLLRS